MDRLSLRFPTSGLAVLGFDGAWASLAPETAHLRDFVVPRG
jgi:phosphohistidine phosphatase SixA